MKAATERVDLPVSGMTCAACARGIERKLTKTPGVERANVNFATGTATVEYDAGQVKVRNFVDAIEGRVDLLDQRDDVVGFVANGNDDREHG